MTDVIGTPVPRIDGRAKVMGAARYAADFNQAGQAYAVLVSATIGLGRVTGIGAAAVETMPGVVAVISHLNAPRLPYAPHKGPIDPPVGERLHLLQDEQVRFHGQPVAVVVAETLDQAEHAAAALDVSYEGTRPVVDMADPAAEPITPESRGRIAADSTRGDADAALGSAPVRFEAEYLTARENHNPMEPHATVAAWEGNRLTIWSKSQFVVNEQAEIAAVFGLVPKQVQVICPFIGGAFGTSLRTWPHVTLAALAARVTDRPVKLVLTRKQMFFTTGHRPRTRQRVALGSTNDGRLTAVVHEGTGETSRYEQFVEALTSATTFMYSCPNVRTSYRLTPLDSSTPNHMRGPGEATGIFALECAIDELSYELGLDPVRLRLDNDTNVDEGEGKPFSSRSLAQCLQQGAERFGWSRRTPAPRSMRDGRLLIGQGVSAATYPALQSPTDAWASMLPDGTVEIEVAASDMGPGTYTSMTQVAAETLGLPIERVRFHLGRSDFPSAPSHGGSQTMASVGTAVRDACVALRGEAVRRAAADSRSPLYGADVDELVWERGAFTRGEGRSKAMTLSQIVAGLGVPIEAHASSRRDPLVASEFSMHAFGAVFVEVSVDPDVGIIRVRRAVGVYGCGRIINPRLAKSQCTGGMVGGIGMALMEQTVHDTRDGRPVNAHMADYLLPVNLDVATLESYFVDEQDPHVNPLGVKGIGEIALVGMAPAIANAVYHATGVRVRSLPIRIEQMLAT